MDPVLIEVPERIETERLILRCPRPGDGPTVNEAERETLQELKPWMPWAQTAKSLDESESYCRRMQARYLLREDLVMFIFERDVMGREGRFLGGTGLHRIDWTLRRFEIGYWCRTGRVGQGYVGEAVRALTRLVFDELRGRRVEVRPRVAVGERDRCRSEPMTSGVGDPLASDRRRGAVEGADHHGQGNDQQGDQGAGALAMCCGFHRGRKFLMDWWKRCCCVVSAAGP